MKQLQDHQLRAVRIAAGGMKEVASCLLSEAGLGRDQDPRAAIAKAAQLYSLFPASRRYFDGVASLRDAKKYTIAVCRAVAKALAANMDDLEPSEKGYHESAVRT